MFCTEMWTSASSNTLNYVQYATCRKCNAEFKLDYGGFSERASCRIHHRGKKECKDCHLPFPISCNCYHVKETWWDFFFGWIKFPKLK